MSRLLNADSGEIYLNGELLNRKKSSDIAKQLAILKQTNNINLRLTIEDLVAFGRFPYSKGNLTQTDRTFIDNAIAYMNLDDIRHQYIDNLSGGQRQRAYIAMTLAQDTDYILLDEPLNNLDMKHSVQIMQVLRKLATELNKTVVIVIHDINFASCYSDYIVAMKMENWYTKEKLTTLCNHPCYKIFTIWRYLFRISTTIKLPFILDK